MEVRPKDKQVLAEQKGRGRADPQWRWQYGPKLSSGREHAMYEDMRKFQKGQSDGEWRAGMK